MDLFLFLSAPGGGGEGHGGGPARVLSKLVARAPGEGHVTMDLFVGTARSRTRRGIGRIAQCMSILSLVGSQSFAQQLWMSRDGLDYERVWFSK